MLYAATLTTDLNTLTQIYRSAEKQYPNDWRTSNNLGCVLLMQNKVSEAGEAFKRAEKAAASQPEVANNLGIIEAKNGNRSAAMELYKKQVRLLKQNTTWQSSKSVTENTLML